MKNFVRWVYDKYNPNNVVGLIAVVWATMLGLGTVLLFGYLLNSGHFLLAGAFSLVTPAAFLLALYLFDQFRK